MVGRSNKPSALPVSPTAAEFVGAVNADSDKVVLSLPSGESVTISLYGATVTSWKTADGQERLFLSDKAKLDGTKAIRGGIPLVFPVFGTTESGPASNLPQHGFARISKWELLGRTSESATSVQVDLGLSSANISAEIREKWSFEFGLIYSVTLSGKSLETKILIRNEGDQTFNFQVLFHTYFRISDISSVNITGLKGVTYKDKIKNGATATEEAENLGLQSETDRVYAGVAGTVKVRDRDSDLYTIERKNLEDVVVWNPWTEASKKMGDFGPQEGWKNMICVEAGSVATWNSLESNSVWEGGQVIRV